MKSVALWTVVLLTPLYFVETGCMTWLTGICVSRIIKMYVLYVTYTAKPSCNFLFFESSLQDQTEIYTLTSQRID